MNGCFLIAQDTQTQEYVLEYAYVSNGYAIQERLETMLTKQEIVQRAYTLGATCETFIDTTKDNQ